MLEKQGASVVGQVSSGTTMLLAGEDAGSKLEKAQKLGISQLTESKFLSLLGMEP